MKVSPPAGPLPGYCEAPATSPSFWQRARDAVTGLRVRYGTARFWISIAIVFVLISGAGLQLGKALHIVMKAHVAQALIRHAWQENLLAGEPNMKPWPWADMAPVARMTLVRQRAELFVLNNDAPRTLAFGPGFRPQSTLPGRGGKTVISAHRDTHFSVLENIAPGDLIEIQTIEGRELLYQVYARQVVDMHDMWVTEDNGQNELTLITCWPFDALVPRGPDRLIVSALPYIPPAITR